jgi:hypothetical protein
MKRFLAVLLMLLVGTSAYAAPYNFKGAWVDVDAWTGAGANEAILVVDWNRLDNGPNTLSESHAFGYRWDGVASELDMLLAFNQASVLTVAQGSFGSGWLDNISYAGPDGEFHCHIEQGSWNLASTSDPSAKWGTFFDSEWHMNTGMMDTEILADGKYEGINAIMFYSELPAYADDQLNIPFAAAPVPIPCAAWLLGSGLAALTGLRSRRLLPKKSTRTATALSV